MRGAPRQRPLSHGDVVRRAEHARAFLETTTDAQTLHADRANVVIANAVLAGIAAADPMCGHALGVSARGEAHDEATRLLATVARAGPRCTDDLRRLLAVKTNSACSPLVMSSAAAQDALRWAGRLIVAMDGVLSGP